MRPKRRPPRPKHPKFTHFHRSGLRFGRFPAQHRSIGGVGGRRRDRRAWLRRPWAVAGPGRIARQRAKPDLSTPGPTGVEGAGGPGCGARGRWRDLARHRDDAPNQKTATRHHWCGGRRRDLPRCRWAVAGPGRASRSTTPSRRLACGDLAGGPPPTGASSSPA